MRRRRAACDRISEDDAVPDPCRSAARFTVACTDIVHRCLMSEMPAKLTQLRGTRVILSTSADGVDTDGAVYRAGAGGMIDGSKSGRARFRQIEWSRRNPTLQAGVCVGEVPLQRAAECMEIGISWNADWRLPVGSKSRIQWTACAAPGNNPMVYERFPPISSSRCL